MHTKLLNNKTRSNGLIHVLVKHTDYKVSVSECTSFGDEFFCYRFVALALTNKTQ